MKNWYQGKTGICIVLLYASLCFLPGLGRVSLFDRDEPRFAEAAREMIVRGSYLVPYFNNEPRLHKPPLIYWVMTAAYKIFGVSEFSARIGSALAGVLTVLLVYLLARKMFDPLVAMLSALLLASSAWTIVIARAATADSLQLLTVMITFWGFWNVYQGDRRFLSYALLYGGLALGGLAKGPVVLAVFLVAAAGIALQERRLGLLKELRLVPGMLAAMGIVALWLIPANQATNGDFIRVGIGHHVLDRAFSQSMEGHRGPPFYYLVLLPITFAPWFALLPLSVRRMWRSPAIDKSRVFLFAWAVAPFLIFSFLKTKLPHYTLPAFPALAIITAYGLDAAIRERESLWTHWLGKAGICILLIGGIVLATALAGFPFYAGIGSLQRVFLGPVLLLVAMLACGINDLRRRRNGMFAFDISAGIMLLILSVGLFYLPAMDENCAAHVLAEKVGNVAHEGDAIISVGYREPSLVFYARRPVEYVSNWDKVEASTDRDFICIARDKNLRDIPSQLRQELTDVGHASAFLLTKGRWESWTLLSSHLSTAGSSGRE